MVSVDRVRFFYSRFREKLWVKPLGMCLLSIAAAFAAKFADGTSLAQIVPGIAAESVDTLLSIMASSMLVIATFSVASMVSAYASAGSTATPRSFTLVVADDASQNALSTFVGAFIFSIVAITAMKNGFFGTAGLFILFVLTVFVFATVIITLIGWVDRIARLGRVGSTIDQVEVATAGALERRRDAPNLGGVAIQSQSRGEAVFASTVGYVQHIDMAALQAWAEEQRARVVVAALPGTFAAPDQVLAYVMSERTADLDCQAVASSFQVGGNRLFDDDPRFGLVVLSEIAGRALSPGINDPGTAIDVVGTLVRLLALWGEPAKDPAGSAPVFDRIEVPEISARDLFDDAFTATARDGAGVVEVAVRLQKALRSLASLDDANMHEAAKQHSRLALKRAERAMDVEEDLAVIRAVAQWAAA